MSAVLTEKEPISVKLKYMREHHPINGDDCKFCSDWNAGKYPAFDLDSDDPEMTVIQLMRAGF